MKKTLKNSKMVELLHQLQPLLSHRDIIGYAVARNYRALSASLTEYETFRDSLIEKLGEHKKDDHGVELPLMQIKIGSPNFKQFCDEMAPFNNMEHEVELMTLKFKDTIGLLSGEEILAIDWMLED